MGENSEFKIPSEIPFSGFNQDTKSQDNLNTNWRNIDHYHHNYNNQVDAMINNDSQIKKLSKNS